MKLKVTKNISSVSTMPKIHVSWKVGSTGPHRVRPALIVPRCVCVMIYSNPVSNLLLAPSLL